MRQRSIVMAVMIAFLMPQIATNAAAVVLCERANRRGVVKKVRVRPGSECRGKRETPVAAPGAVGIGTIIAHTTHEEGATSVAEMQAAGFAVCDGTTPAEQGMADAVLDGPTPNLNGNRLFLRGTFGDTGVFQPDSTAINELHLLDSGHEHESAVGTFCDQGSGPVVSRAFFDATCAGGLTATQTSSSNITLASSATETRPANMSVLWMIRVR
jgi:hypothetical protein